MDERGDAANPEQDSTPYRVDLTADPTREGDDVVFGPIRFYRHKSPNGLPPVVFDPGDGRGRAVRLSVQAGTYAGPLDEPGDSINDRCELRGPKQLLGTDVWHAFAIRVPADFPIVPLRCVVAQMKMPYDASGGGSPAFALRIEDGAWLATVEHLYEPDDQKAGRYLSDPGPGGRCLAGVPAFDHSNFNKYERLTDFQVRAVLAGPAAPLPAPVRTREFTRCTTGVSVERIRDLPVFQAGGGWTDFAVHIRSSGRKDVDGLIELYTDGLPVARARGEFGYPSTEGDPVQYFKIGLYRNHDPAWGTVPAALEYRDIRRGRSADEVGLRPADEAAPRLVAVLRQLHGSSGNDGPRRSDADRKSSNVGERDATEGARSDTMQRQCDLDREDPRSAEALVMSAQRLDQIVAAIDDWTVAITPRTPDHQGPSATPSEETQS